MAHLLNQGDSVLEIHAEVDELPLDAFLLVLLLLEHKHVVVEELLQTLVRVVDAQLLERVVLSIYEYQTMNVLYCQHMHIKPLTCCTVNIQYAYQTFNVLYCQRIRSTNFECVVLSKHRHGSTNRVANSC